ncbi:MAG: phage tail assembly chaperone [Pseudomonadota bacterium]
MKTFATAATITCRLATGRLGWSPDAFWAATPADLVLALEGLSGGGTGEAAPVTGDQLQRLKEAIDG